MGRRQPHSGPANFDKYGQRDLLQFLSPPRAKGLIGPPRSDQILQQELAQPDYGECAGNTNAGTGNPLPRSVVNRKLVLR